ncbi:GTP-binding protein, partial [Amanita rubescens]
MTTDPALEAAKIRAKYTHFRILVIGRANAGKTTLLRRVCNTKEDPVYSQINPTLKRGNHNVHDEFSFKSNPQFIFHDSPGFEAGGEQELQDVHSFIQEKAKATEVKDQIHAIWFCFAPDVSRPLLELEQRFFNEQYCGNVPVVAIFTKFDDLITQVYDRNEEDEKNREIACVTLEKKFEKPLKGYKFPPCAYVQFESIQEDNGNHQEQVGELIKQTAASIDNLALKMLFVTVQQNNLEVCIEYAVNKFIFEDTSTVYNLIHKAASWFGHCYSQGGNKQVTWRIPN